MRRLVVAAALVVVGVCVFAAPAGAVNRGKVRKPGPVRVALMGDSLSYNYGQSTINKLPGYVVTADGIPQTGLVDADVCSGARARAILASDPDVVVVEYTGNWQTPAASCVPPGAAYGSQKWFSAWKKSARQTQKILKSRGAIVVWAQVPMPRPDIGHAAVVPKLNAFYKTMAPKIGTVDLWTAFGGATYNAALHSDGLHLSVAGIDVAAGVVAAKVKALKAP